MWRLKRLETVLNKCYTNKLTYLYIYIYIYIYISINSAVSSVRLVSLVVVFTDSVTRFYLKKVMTFFSPRRWG